MTKRGAPADVRATSPRTFRIAVIGGGLAGLSCAHTLAKDSRLRTTLFEREAHLGGRASAVGSAEHCQRLFLEDYDVLLQILSEIPVDGGSVHSRLHEVKRFSKTVTKGWVEIDHPYSIFARQISFLEKCRILVASRRSVLAARQVKGARTNFLGGPDNDYTLLAKFAIARSFLRRQKAFQLPLGTKTDLIDPWAEHLRSSGVKLQVATSIRRLETTPNGPILIESTAGSAEFDAVVIAVFHPDAIALLDDSDLHHSLSRMRYAQCPCYTIEFGEEESSERVREPALYSFEGIGITVQPAARRCLVLCVRSVRTDQAWVLDRVTEALALSSRPAAVYCRPNQHPSEGLFIGNLTRPSRIVDELTIGNLTFAGSWTSGGYPVDSGENAARSGVRAATHVLNALTAGWSAA